MALAATKQSDQSKIYTTHVEVEVLRQMFLYLSPILFATCPPKARPRYFCLAVTAKASKNAKGFADARDAVGIHGKQKVVTGQGHVDICRQEERKGVTALSCGQR
jgi:hypothetical protein